MATWRVLETDGLHTACTDARGGGVLDWKEACLTETDQTFSLQRHRLGGQSYLSDRSQNPLKKSLEKKYMVPSTDH